MGFLGVYKAVYDYAPQSDGELSLTDGDVLYVLEKSSEDNWWKAKKKASADDEDEPVGLVPNNYVEEAQPVAHARSLYEYTRQTDEELSFPEDAPLRVYDSTDPDWILVGYESDYGFVPANYIELGGAPDAYPDAQQTSHVDPEPEQDSESELPPSLPDRPSVPVASLETMSPPLPTRPLASQDANPSPSPPPPTGPAAALAGVMQGRSSSSARAATPPPITLPPRYQRPQADDYEEEQSPALPTRVSVQPSYASRQSVNSPASPPLPQRTSSRYDRSDRNQEAEPQLQPFSPLAPGGFHMYNINEMVSVMGKKKKMPTTLGINLRTGVILIAPERTSDGPTQEWTAEKMTHYSREGKHVFLELVRPSKSIDFHAGAKDTAEEIVSSLGELSGAMRAEGLREVIAAGTSHGGPKRGQMLYDFMAQGDDEVTVALGDEVIILDNKRSEEWWQVRRLKNGKEGVVPSSYVEVIDAAIPQPPQPPPASTSGVNAGKSAVAQNRMEEERLTKEALKKDQTKAEVGPGMRLPERHSSLSIRNTNNHSSTQQRSRRDNGRPESSRSASSKPKPDPAKVRNWTDRSKSFSVEAQFLGLKDGKINLHKMNGVKIAVPLAKMSIEDIEYVERTTGISLDEDKPLSEMKRRKSTRSPPVNANKNVSSSHIGASIESGKPDYDWFQFFLSCDVAVGLCERYAQAFSRDSMDESVLPDVDASILRNLGIREGDIIKIMRTLDKKYNRDSKKKGAGEAEEGGLFSGPGGTLRNNTRKGRPAPAVQASDVVDAKTFSQSPKDAEPRPPPSKSPDILRPAAAEKATSGFDDDAWDVKPSRQPEPQPKPIPNPELKTPTTTTATTAPVQPASPPTQAMQDLSLLSQPLEPTKAEAPAPAAPGFGQPQPQGATPSFFTGIPANPTGSVTPAQPLNLGLGNRQRPTPPPTTGTQGVIMPPPPARPLSAPQSALPSGFAPPPAPPLQPHMTGIAPPGQSLSELQQQRLQQSYMGNFQPQSTGQGMMLYAMQQQQRPQQGYASQQFMTPQMTGASQMPMSYGGTQQFSPMQSQPTGFANNFQPSQQFPQSTGVTTFLPSALEPQKISIASMQSQPTGFGGFQSNSPPPQPAPIPALVPQQTGPAPSVRFGVAKPLAPQPTGRRANLAQASKLKSNLTISPVQS
ncbi:hypothetical protein F5Y18DRAFT_417359 [Xylariaceae sp. FL1019]|nr:hypothetical protein F5Y18DRAFT_417359 [Xylariaceae sp. FL1019]